jgi:hypothetical protein
MPTRWASGATTTATTLAVSPVAIGDVMVLFCLTTSSTNNLSTVTGGGVGTWARVMGPTANAGTGTAERVEIWIGATTAVGAATITLAWTTAIGTTGRTFACKELTSGGGAGTVWAADGSGGSSANTTSSANVTYPTLTPAGLNRAYVGFAYVQNTGQASGQTAGYSVELDPNNNIVLYNPQVANSAQSPVGIQSAAGTSDAWGVLIQATNRPPRPIAQTPQTPRFRSYNY